MALHPSHDVIQGPYRLKHLRLASTKRRLNPPPPVSRRPFPRRPAGSWPTPAHMRPPSRPARAGPPRRPPTPRTRPRRRRLPIGRKSARAKGARPLRSSYLPQRKGGATLAEIMLIVVCGVKYSFQPHLPDRRSVRAAGTTRRRYYAAECNRGPAFPSL
jgi:hypothetical protein